MYVGLNRQRVFLIPRSEEIECKTIEIYWNIYESDLPRRPLRISQETKELKMLINNHMSKCTFLGEFPSVKGRIQQQGAEMKPMTHWLISAGLNHDRYPPKSTNTLSTSTALRMFDSCKDVFNTVFQLNRVKASQVVVMMISNMDRTWIDTGHQKWVIPRSLGIS